MGKEPEIYVGTSGWEYGDWKLHFYPPGLKTAGRLGYYASIFNAVEVNSTFYRNIRRTTAERWREITHALNFSFVCKLHRYFTHLRRLDLSGDPIELRLRLQEWWEGIQPLEPQLLGILVQLPPSLVQDISALKRFGRFLREVIPASIPLFLEARHSSWAHPEVVDSVEQAGFYWVVSHSSRWQSVIPEKKEMPWLYLRFHGPREPFRSLYSEGELQQWVEQVRNLQPHRVLAFFNNTFRARAVQNARTFQRLLEEELSRARSSSSSESSNSWT